MWFFLSSPAPGYYSITHSNFNTKQDLKAGIVLLVPVITNTEPLWSGFFSYLYPFPIVQLSNPDIQNSEGGHVSVNMAGRGSCAHEVSYRVTRKKIMCFKILKSTILRIEMKRIKAVENIAKCTHEELYSVQFILYTENNSLWMV
jgi:hypothetical protein